MRQLIVDDGSESLRKSSFQNFNFQTLSGHSFPVRILVKDTLQVLMASRRQSRKKKKLDDPARLVVGDKAEAYPIVGAQMQ